MKVVPMVGNSEQYRQMLAWVKHGYLTGYRNGERKGSRAARSANEP